MKRKKIESLFLLIVLFLSMITSCGSDTKLNGKNNKVNADSLKTVMVSGAPLSNIRPAENELSEEEILVKTAEYVIDNGYYNRDYAKSIDERLLISKIETPIFLYCDFEDCDEIGYYLIYAVDESGNAVAGLTCSGNVYRKNDAFIGSVGVYNGEDCIITQREAKEIYSEHFPEKVFTDPEMISIKKDNDWYPSDYWYIAAVDRTSQEKSFSKALEDNPSAVVEEYIIGSLINGSKNINSKSLSNVSDSSWEGIMKITEPANYYKVILANKTKFDESTQVSKGISEGSLFKEYRGKSLKFVHSFEGIKTTPVVIN